MKSIGKKKLKLNDILERASKFAYNNKDFIVSITTASLYNDEPQLFSFSGKYTVHDQGNKEHYNMAFGVSFDEKVALMRVLGEGIERYCLDNFIAETVAISSLDELNSDFLNPLEVSPFSKKQLEKESFKEYKITDRSKFSWTKGFSLPKNKEVLIPSQLITFNYDLLKNEPIIISPLSTGVAAGSSLEDALYRAICEIIERDSLMISYLNKLSSPHVDLHEISDVRIKKLLAEFERYNLELKVLDTTTDLGIPSFVAIAIDRTELGPSVSIGAKAGFEEVDAIINAVEETLMSRAWIRDQFIYQDPDYIPKKEISDLKDRAHLWFPIKMIEELNFWLKDSSVSKRKITNVKKEKLKAIINILQKHDTDIIYSDITHDKIKDNGFSVVKVIIPQLQPLYLNEKTPYFGIKRLYDAPVAMKMLENKNTEFTLNHLPHPFL